MNLTQVVKNSDKEVETLKSWKVVRLENQDGWQQLSIPGKHAFGINRMFFRLKPKNSQTSL